MSSKRFHSPPSACWGGGGGGGGKKEEEEEDKAEDYDQVVEMVIDNLADEMIQNKAALIEQQKDSHFSECSLRRRKRKRR